MKKTITHLTTFILLIILSISAVATSHQSDTNIEIFDDGSYLVTTINEENSSYSTFATIAKNGSKQITYYNDEDELVWEATVSGTFTYTGSSSTCTDADITYTIYNSVWRVTSASAIESGNTAIGDITVKKYFGGVPLQTIEETITLSCSATGVLS